MNTIGTFIYLEGMLAETGTFELRAAREVADAPSQVRYSSVDDGLAILLLDRDGAALTSVTPRVVYPTGCSPTAARPGAGLVRAAIARHEQGHRVEVRLRQRLLFAGEVAPVPPVLDKVAVSVNGSHAVVAYRVGEASAEVRLLAQLASGRTVLPVVRSGAGTFQVDLRQFQGRGTVRFLVEATNAFRSARAVTDTVQLPAADVRGRILEPAPGSVWAWGYRGSLSAIVFDDAGRQLAWDSQQLRWRVDGALLPDATQMATWRADPPGSHTLQLVRDTGNGQFDVLDQRTLFVNPATPDQLHHAALFGIPAEHGGNGEMPRPEDPADPAADGTIVPGSVSSDAIQVHDIRMDPTSPAVLTPGGRVNVVFRYRSEVNAGVRIFVRPMTGDTLSTGYAASGSPTHPAGSGEATAHFTIRGDGVVDGVRFQIMTADQTALLEEFLVRVRYNFIA